MLAGKSWTGRDGASVKDIDYLGEVTNYTLPDSYLSFLRFSNGGEGSLTVDHLWLVLVSAKDVAETENKGVFHEFFPELLVIGSNGAGEAVAFYMRDNIASAIVYFDMTNIDLAESIKPLAKSFSELLVLIEPQIQ